MERTTGANLSMVADVSVRHHNPILAARVLVRLVNVLGCLLRGYSCGPVRRPEKPTWGGAREWNVDIHLFEDRCPCIQFFSGTTQILREEFFRFPFAPWVSTTTEPRRFSPRLLLAQRLAIKHAKVLPDAWSVAEGKSFEKWRVTSATERRFPHQSSGSLAKGLSFSAGTNQTACA